VKLRTDAPPKKRPKPLQRKGGFRVYDNEFKVYKTDAPAVIRLKPEQCRAEQKAANNIAEWTSSSISTSRVTRLPEIDGKCHAHLLDHDRERDGWFATQGTERFVWSQPCLDSEPKLRFW
jgi:hypothetical protein